MGHFYETMHTTGEWLQTHGVESEAAARYITGITQTYMAEAAHRIEDEGKGVSGFAELVDEQTPGGLNQSVIKLFEENETYKKQTDALDGVWSRLNPLKNK